MNVKLQDKYAVITGASTGIGKAIAIEFAKEGAFVFLTARTTDRLKAVQQIIINNGGKAEVIPADLSNIAVISGFINSIKDVTDRIDVIVNVAGVWHDQGRVYAANRFELFSQDVIVKTYNVGITAPTLIVHGLLPLMPSKSKILNISGKFSHGAKNWLPYYMSKKAIEDLTVGLSEELLDRNIEVNCISPSDTGTESYQRFYPRVEEKTLAPEEVAQFACRLCSSETDNITGKVFVMIAGRQPYEAFHT